MRCQVAFVGVTVHVCYVMMKRSKHVPIWIAERLQLLLRTSTLFIAGIAFTVIVIGGAVWVFVVI